MLLHMLQLGSPYPLITYVISGAEKPTSGGFSPIRRASQLLSAELRSSQAIITFHYLK